MKGTFVHKLHTDNEDSALELGAFACSQNKGGTGYLERGWHVVLMKHFYRVSHVVMFRVAIGRPTKLDLLAFYAPHSQLLFRVILARRWILIWQQRLEVLRLMIAFVERAQGWQGICACLSWALLLML